VDGIYIYIYPQWTLFVKPIPNLKVTNNLMLMLLLEMLWSGHLGFFNNLLLCVVWLGLETKNAIKDHEILCDLA
jgi:hypothetical protein